MVRDQVVQMMPQKRVANVQNTLNQKPTCQRELSGKNIFDMKKETEWVKKEEIRIVEVSVI